MFFEVLELFFECNTVSGNFAGADFRFDFSLDFKINIFNSEVIILKGGGDNSEVAIAELFDVEGIFDTYDNVAIFVGYNRGALKPS